MKKRIKALVLDSLINVLVFSPPISFIVGFLPEYIPILGEPWGHDDYVRYWTIGIVIGAILGAVFGRIINVWRKLLKYQ